jgi:hypothetical protein
MPWMTRRAARSLVVGALSIVVTIALATEALAVGFTRVQSAAEPFSWNPGKSLATATGHLLSAWATDCPPPSGACATNKKPTMRVFVQRAPGGTVPAAWGRPARVSPKDVHAERVSLAADGNLVAVGWVTQRSYLHYDPRAPRVFWIRISTDRGHTWHRAQRISVKGGRVDYPRVAVSNGSIAAVWTNADTGEIRMAITVNRGGTWTKGTVATTTSRSDGSREGYAGLADVGMSGDNVAVVWFANPSGTTRAAFSAAGGADLLTPGAPSTMLVDSSPNDGQRYPAAAGSPTDGDPRVAVAFTTNGGLVVRVWDGVTLGAELSVANFPDASGGTTYAGGYGPAVLPVALDELLVAFAGCRSRSGLSDPCDPSDPGARIDVLYTQSADAGSSWTAIQQLAAATKRFRTNDEPSVTTTSGRRRITFDGYGPAFTRYRVRMRSSR